MHASRPAAPLMGICMNRSHLVALLFAVMLAGCQSQSEASDPAGPPVATVDGEPISRSLYDFFVKASSGQSSDELSAEQREQVLDSLVSLQLLAAQARKQGLDQKTELLGEMQLAELDVLQRAVVQSYLQDKTPTEQELRAEYDTQVAQMAPNEYRARHILLPSEADANRILARLNKGERFESLAKESLDASRDQGGDLGWFSPSAMVKPFADAVMALGKGATTAAPVQSQFGWHIIRVDDVRKTEPPPFEQVQQQLSQAVLAKKFRAYTDELKKAAKIDKSLPPVTAATETEDTATESAETTNDNPAG
ncbi:MAG: peptidylprolyl isomerase [Gammaproteobacteria bacterium]|nr:peptidylprolyl isomerase [Gammaproteobacteria bacterium]